MDRLQDILYYRALGVELARIGAILDDPSFDRLDALRGHLAALEKEEGRIQELIHTVKRTILSEERNEFMSDEAKFEAFKRRAVEENEALTDEGRGMVEEIHQNAQWLLHLSENILSVTRFCDEGVVIEKSDEVVEEIVGSAIRRFRKNCKTDIPITVSKPEEILLVPMDATLIEQVLLNLLENVAKHSPSATEIFIEIRKDARRVWLTVADNGDGIPPQLLGVLFDGYLPLGAVEASDRSRHMGIGLSVCRAIVRAHGGEIYARNKIDGGAEFRFWLPAEEESNT